MRKEIKNTQKHADMTRADVVGDQKISSNMPGTSGSTAKRGRGGQGGGRERGGAEEGRKHVETSVKELTA